jgi:hypothetical protein
MGSGKEDPIATRFFSKDKDISSAILDQDRHKGHSRVKILISIAILDRDRCKANSGGKKDLD